MTATLSCPFHQGALAFDRSASVVLAAAAVLPDVVGDTPRLPNAVHLEAQRLLNELSTSLLSPALLSERLRSLADLASAHAACFVPDVPVPDPEASAAVSLDAPGLRDVEIVERIRYDEFFDIRRTARLDARTLAHATFSLLAPVLADVADAHLHLHDHRALLRGVVAATAWIEHVEHLPITSPVQPSPDPLERFRLGHHVFALLCSFGIHHLRSAAAALPGLETEEHLLRAAWFVRATTAAMWYSIAFPPADYRQAVRPAMDAASTLEHGFSGLDNFEFRRLREAWEALHDDVVGTWANLDDAVRSAALLLYETIVGDNEHHTGIAAEMVGLLPSLNGARQAERHDVQAMAAVRALRANTDDRRVLLDQLRDLDTTSSYVHVQ